MKYGFMLLFAGVLVACNSGAAKEETTGKPEPKTDTAYVQQQDSGELANQQILWRVTPDYEKIKNKKLSPSQLTADDLIRALNANYDNVYLEKTKIGGDTIYTIIKDATYLAEQMGTTGAEMYLADVVLNLTAVSGINYVNIQLEEGSHMQPGTWSAADFVKYKEIN